MALQPIGDASAAQIDNLGEFATPQELLDSSRNGRIVILAMSSGPDATGAMVLPAQLVTPAAVNFMAKNGRGLVCLCLTSERAVRLGLPKLGQEQGGRQALRYAVSIEAFEGVSTGISAADRARTVSVASDPANGPDSIVTPGHVFPVIARKGGVLAHKAFPEAGVDLARLSGLWPAAIACEILEETGDPARLVDLVRMAREHGLAIGTIGGLFSYRLRSDRNIERGGEIEFHSHFGGAWRAIGFRDCATGRECVALVKGCPTSETTIYTHQLNLLVDVLGEVRPESNALEAAMRKIEQEGAGLIVLLGRESHDSILDCGRRGDGEPLCNATSSWNDEGSLAAQVVMEIARKAADPEGDADWVKSRLFCPQIEPQGFADSA